MITVDDDTPIATAGRSTGTVDEDGVVEGCRRAWATALRAPRGDVAGRPDCDSGLVGVPARDEPLTVSLNAAIDSCRRWV